MSRKSTAVALILVFALHPRLVSAQPSGTLAPPSDPRARTEAERRVLRVFGRAMGFTELRKFSLLVVDPDLTSALLSSAWTFSVDVAGAPKEGRVQANVCDLAKLCGRRNALGLTLSGPVDSESKFVALPKLDNLVGTPRLGVNYSYKITDANGDLSGSLQGVVGRPHFNFRQIPTLTPDTLDKTVYSVSAALGKKWVDHSYQFSFKYQDARTANAAQNVCRPATFGGPGTQTCTNLIVGEPVRQISQIAALEVRFVMDVNTSMAVRIADDFRSGSGAIDIPIYFSPHSENTEPAKNNALGGVRLMFRNKPEQFALGFFLGAFKL
jgi:hypothetical protein